MAAQHGTDPLLVESIMMVENVQRPRWFRTAERLKGIFAKPGTYGIMQVASPRPLSDKDSIRIAIETRLAGQTVPIRDPNSRYPTFDSAVVHTHALAYNPSADYADA